MRALSYSAIATFKQCPAKFKFAYLDDIQVAQEPPSPAMERGTKIHNSVEDYLLHKNEYLHPEIHKDYGQFMLSIRSGYAEIHPEFKWAIGWDFHPCEYDSPKAMVRGFIDNLGIPEDKSQPFSVYEWKTGGIYPEHASQVCMYATSVMLHYPEATGVDAVITYFDKQDFNRISYPRTMLHEYRHQLQRSVTEIVHCRRWTPMPSFKCKWCSFSRHNGGPCHVA